MSKSFAIIDLFAGPGGLGEGFSQAGRHEDTPMKIHLSIEMDEHAIQTLRLRAFLRKFDDFPPEYYEALNRGTNLPDWESLYPENWRDAKAEVRQCVLGADGVFEEVAVELDRVKEAHQGNTILIGGPPCQAYSLVGRSRNKGKTDYVAEADHRHYLYREYVRILDRLSPAAFVMENVKGMLSSKVDGGGIFNRVLDDLEGAGSGYRLLPLTAPIQSNGIRPEAKDFLVRAEQHGIPQARHRVIILGIRSDIAVKNSPGEIFLDGPQSPVSVSDAISDLATLRSGLSSKDDADRWQTTIRDQASRLAGSNDLPDAVRQIIHAIAIAKDLPQLRKSGLKVENTAIPENLRVWCSDLRLETNLQHETRGHIPNDLGRYMFSSAWTQSFGRSPKLSQFPAFLQPEHRNRASGNFVDRFRTQAADRPSTTVTSHISKDGHYFIHPDPMQCRSLTVREAARLQTFPDNYFFCGPRTKQYHQVGNAVPPYLAYQIALAVMQLLK